MIPIFANHALDHLIGVLVLGIWIRSVAGTIKALEILVVPETQFIIAT